MQGSRIIAARRVWLLAAALWLPARAARADGLPDAIGRQLPAGYRVLEMAQGRLTGGTRDDYAVVLARPGDDPDGPLGAPATARPLLLFRASPDGGYRLIGRNDVVVLRHDEGGQCDPFNPGQGLAMKGAYLTVQNEVACGAYWSDYVTFRHDRAGGRMLFDSDIVHTWILNPSDAPGAEALVPAGPPTVTRADPRHSIGFSAWRPPQ